MTLSATRQAKAPSTTSNQRQAGGLGRTGIAFVCLLALLACSGIGASAALAGQTRPPEPFSPLAEPESITDPRGIAVDEASGNVFVNDTGSHTEILGAEGGAPTGLVPPFVVTSGCSPAFNENSIAVDNGVSSVAKGTVYVVCTNGKIRRFTRDALTETYVAGPEISYPGDVRQAPATVDANGNLYVGGGVGTSSTSIYKFDPAGSLLQTIAPLPGLPASIAIDSTGSLFLVRSGVNDVYKCSADTFGEIDATDCVPFAGGTEGSARAAAVAVDRTTDTLFVSYRERVEQYDAITLTKELEFGANVLSNARGVIVNSATDRVYVSDTGIGNDNVAVFGSPAPIPDVTTKGASDVTGTTATLSGTVNPQNVEVTECFFQYGTTTAYGQEVPCTGATPTDSTNHSVSASIGGLAPNGATYHFRLVVESANGEVKGADRTLTTGNTVFTEPATDIAADTATLNGAVRPEGESFTDCKFEYGTALDLLQSVPCSPTAAAIPDDFDSHDVTGPLVELEPNTTYQFRLAATNASAGTVHGDLRTFTTTGPPQIIEQRPMSATQNTVALQARINPSGLATTYHFEWGPVGSYPNRIPADHELFAGSGSEPLVVSANLDHLQPISRYQFRVVATNPEGTTVGPMQPFETLNQHGLPDNRDFELVTPSDKGPAGNVVSGFLGGAGEQPHPSESGESLIWPLQNGMPETTAGGWLTMIAKRDAAAEGWVSAQVGAPALIQPPKLENLAFVPPSIVLPNATSPDLRCGLMRTYNPVTADTPPLSTELGLSNLYVWRQGSGEVPFRQGDEIVYRPAQEGEVGYELVTDRVPVNVTAEFEGAERFGDARVADGCSRVYFKSRYQWIEGASGLYEWEAAADALRDAGLRPGGSIGGDMGGTGGRAVLGGQANASSTASWGAVTPEGSLFFTALNAAGRPAVFMRTGGGEGAGGQVVEISASETGVAANGARFETASSDGGSVVFRANHGLDAEGSDDEPTNAQCGPILGETEPTNPPIEAKACDLYSYDVASGELSDLSLDSNPADPVGAAIQGVLAVDEDGSHVYFATLGQLTPGEGLTYAQNTAGTGSVNVYLYNADVAPEEALSYVTNLRWVADAKAFALARFSSGWSAETSADGRRLLYAATSRQSWYEGGGGAVAYSYDADADRIRCVSCRPDGKPTGVRADGLAQLSSDIKMLLEPPSRRPRGGLSEDGSKAFFSSPDALAPGAEEGELNLYEWEEGQVHFLAVAERRGQPALLAELQGYLGMSLDGSSAFLATARNLSPHDRNTINDVYAVREGGGFPFSDPPPDCQVDDAVPLEPNQVYCQPVSSQQPDADAPSSPGFVGAGNLSEVGAPRDRCSAKARRAKALSKRAKTLRRKAARATNQRAKRRLAKRSRRAAKAAHRNARAAKRCRGARAANFNRGGAR